jgi:hypothetical protein
MRRRKLFIPRKNPNRRLLKKMKTRVAESWRKRMTRRRKNMMNQT